MLVAYPRKVPPDNSHSEVMGCSKEWLQCLTAVEWVDALNAWAAAQVTNFIVVVFRFSE